MKKLFFAIALFFYATCFTYAQIDLGLPSVAGKGGAANGVANGWECIGINPANLGWKENHNFSMSILMAGLSVQSRALNYGQLKNAITSPSDTFSRADRRVFASLFTSQDGLNVQANINWLALSFRVPKLGGFAINIRDRAFGHIALNSNAADVLFNGADAAMFKDSANYAKKISSLFDSTKISFMHYREMNLAYGTKLFGLGGKKDSNLVNVYGGIGLKYLWGFGNFETIVDDGILTGHSAFSSRAGIDYGKIKNFSPESTSRLFPAVGSGIAFDFGIGIGVGKLKITFSAVDLGKITWNKNALVADDTVLPKPSQFNFPGIKSWDVAGEAAHMFNDSGIVHFKPESSYSTQLPSKFRAGIGYTFSKRLTIGMDAVAPISDNPANLDKAFFAAGMELGLATDLSLSIGLAGNSTYGLSMPLGVKLGHFFGIMEVRAATNDVLTYLAHGKNPNISLAVSLFCFHYDKKDK